MKALAHVSAAMPYLNLSTLSQQVYYGSLELLKKDETLSKSEATLLDYLLDCVTLEATSSPPN